MTLPTVRLSGPDPGRGRRRLRLDRPGEPERSSEAKRSPGRGWSSPARLGTPRGTLGIDQHGAVAAVGLGRRHRHTLEPAVHGADRVWLPSEGEVLGATPPSGTSSSRTRRNNERASRCLSDPVGWVDSSSRYRSSDHCAGRGNATRLCPRCAARPVRRPTASWIHRRVSLTDMPSTSSKSGPARRSPVSVHRPFRHRRRATSDRREGRRVCRRGRSTHDRAPRSDH